MYIAYICTFPDHNLNAQWPTLKAEGDMHATMVYCHYLPPNLL